MAKTDAREWWEHPDYGYLAGREVAPGVWVYVQPMIFNFRLTVGNPDWHDDNWDYDHLGDALVACRDWDGTGDPPGPWRRHVGSGRRRYYEDGRLVREEIRP